MTHKQKNFVLCGLVLTFLLLLLVACGSNGDGNGTANAGSTNVVSTITPQLVTPKTAKGEAGKGPLVISSPTPVPGGKAGSQQIVLADRVLVINGASKQKGAAPDTTLINLDVTIQNTSSKSILNQSTYYMLMGPEGDTFGYQYNSSDTFYGPIAAHTTRNGFIVFQVPSAATTSLRLIYRSEVATETAIVLLKL